MNHLTTSSESQLNGIQSSTANRPNIKASDLNMKSIVKIIRTLMERNLLPCIIFSFSRLDCEEYAKTLSSMDLNTGTIYYCCWRTQLRIIFLEHEKHLIKLIFENAIDPLSEEDKKLPHIKNILPLLLRGIGVHHSGQLPIVKEIVEILFGEGLIKVNRGCYRLWRKYYLTK